MSVANRFRQVVLMAIERPQRIDKRGRMAAAKLVPQARKNEKSVKHHQSPRNHRPPCGKKQR